MSPFCLLAIHFQESKGLHHPPLGSMPFPQLLNFPAVPDSNTIPFDILPQN